jgi:hypothetical protein
MVFASRKGISLLLSLKNNSALSPPNFKALLAAVAAAARSHISKRENEPDVYFHQNNYTLLPAATAAYYAHAKLKLAQRKTNI